MSKFFVRSWNWIFWMIWIFLHFKSWSLYDRKHCLKHVKNNWCFYVCDLSFHSWYRLCGFKKKLELFLFFRGYYLIFKTFQRLSIMYNLLRRVFLFCIEWKNCSCCHNCSRQKWRIWEVVFRISKSLSWSNRRFNQYQ